MAEQEYYYALGRRKTATATVRLYFKGGKSTINGKNVEELYPNKAEQKQITEPFKIAEIDPANVMYTVVSKGGGTVGMIGAIRLALSRAIVKKHPEAKKALKTAGLITRDPRMVERKKPGLRKARKAEQYAKR